MRITAHLFCLAASLVAAPAFAQAGKDRGPASSAPQTLNTSKTDQAATSNDDQGVTTGFNFGLNKGGTERTMLPLAPIQKDELALTWKPASNWGVTLDLTSRGQNELFPREEMSAGVTYQVTPRFRFGGGVTVKGDALSDSLTKPGANFAKDVTEAQVRIESAFSF